MSEPGQVFFLSYARDDRVSGPPVGISKFYEDLSRTLRPRISDLDQGEIGFLDTRGIEPGSAWPSSLREALGRVRIFVPVLSPRYFERPYCGKEWAAFASRMPPGARLIQPVLFVPPLDMHPMPSVMRTIQYSDERYPPEYLRAGLSELLNVPTLNDAYMQFLYRFVDVIVKALRESPPMPNREIAPLTDIKSAFHDPQTGDRTKDRSAPPGRRLFARFIYVAARREELEGLRTTLDAYGSRGGFDWQPYLPHEDAEIAIIAGRIAFRERFFYEALELKSDLIERVKEAGENHEVIVVIVDPWTVRLDYYQRLMRELDHLSSTSCVVVIPVNDQDAETVRSRSDLEYVIDATFVNRMTAPDPAAFAPWIGTAAELEDKLEALLAGAKMRVLKSYEVVRRAYSHNLITSPPTIGVSPPRRP